VTRRWVLVLSFAIAWGCGGSAPTSPTPSQSDRTFLLFTADAGFGLRPGQSVELTPDNATFSGFGRIFGAGRTNSVQVTAQDATGATWGLWLAAPPDQQLVAGRYANAVNATSRAPQAPGLTFWNTKFAGCPPATGEFTVVEAALTGSVINRLQATFEQRCVVNGQTISAVRGELNIPRPLQQ